jgi:transcriptional regulator with XRE-family HTH domain
LTEIFSCATIDVSYNQEGGLSLRLRIKEVAEAQGLNRNQLQLRSGVTLPLLTRYWNNTTTEIRLEALAKIAKALGVHPGSLIVSDDEENEGDGDGDKAGKPAA